MVKVPALLAAIACALIAAAPVARASVPLLDINISPLGGAANLGSNIYLQDHAIGLAGANENAQPPSPASGNELGTGITYDSGSKMLAFDFGYGSAFGFSDLGSDFAAVHFHSPGSVNFPAVNTNAGVIHNLSGFHTPSGTLSGRVTGSVLLTAGQETDLFNNAIYINIHSAMQPSGEIRGQLVVVPEPGTATLGALSTIVFFRRRR